MTRCGIILVLASLSHAALAFAAKGNRTYEVVNVTSNCTSEELTVRVELNRGFKGVIYAKGFPLEKNCRSLGTGENHVDILIGTSGCGVRLIPISEDVLSYMVSLNIQMDRFLQQINDIEITSTCKLTPNDMTHTKHAILNKHISRTGRYQTSPEALREDKTLRNIRSWMEIGGTSGKGAASKVAVGEQTLVLVKSLLPDDMTANVVDCFAHDGTREVTQRLLDEEGCPLDESIMPALETIRYEEPENEIVWEAGETTTTTEVTHTTWKPKREKSRKVKTEEKVGGRKTNVEIIPEEVSEEEEKWRMYIIGTMFSAFKFPDTSNLHLKCILQICRRNCPPVTCDTDESPPENRTSKSIKSTEFSRVIDRIEVFNSVEVVAPGIDNDGYTSPEEIDELSSTSGEKTFCLSASKMAFSFAILGAVFLCGVLAALWTIMRNQMRKMNKSYDGSEQILVVRDSPLNLMHSRGKPFTSWSYT